MLISLLGLGPIPIATLQNQTERSECFAKRIIQLDGALRGSPGKRKTLGIGKESVDALPDVSVGEPDISQGVIGVET